MIDQSSIDRDSPVPLYAQLRQALLASIARGDYKIGDIIPGEQTLVHDLGVSQITVRRALKDLVESGYIARKPGLGTIVVRRKINHLSGQIGGVSHDLERQGYRVHTRKLLHAREFPDPLIAVKLQVPTSRKVLRDSRVVLANDEPFGWVESHHNIPASLTFTDAEIERDFIIRVLREKHNVNLVRATRTMEAVLADQVDADMLSVSVGDPLLRAEVVAFGADGRPISHLAAKYRGDRYRYYQDIEVEPLMPRSPRKEVDG